MGLIWGRVPLVSHPAVTSALQLFSSSLSCPPAQCGLSCIQKKGRVAGVPRFLALCNLDQTTSPHREEIPRPRLNDMHSIFARVFLDMLFVWTAFTWYWRRSSSRIVKFRFWDQASVKFSPGSCDWDFRCGLEMPFFPCLVLGVCVCVCMRG